jgi:hypothetical protein
MKMQQEKKKEKKLTGGTRDVDVSGASIGADDDNNTASSSLLGLCHW